MKSKITYYHAGCPVCVNVEETLLSYLDKNRVDIEVVHLGENKSRITEAERSGVKSVPALVINNQVFHINFGADIKHLK